MNENEWDWDLVTQKLKALGEALTRESYLDLAYLGDPPEDLDEESLPPSIRQRH